MWKVQARATETRKHNMLLRAATAEAAVIKLL